MTTSAHAFASFDPDDAEILSAENAFGGAQKLLIPGRQKPLYIAQGAALAVYILALAGATLYQSKPAEAPQEDALELVMLPPATPEEQPAPPEVPPPPPVAEETPPETPPQDLAPPPPVAEEPAVAPVEPPKEKPKPPAPKPKPVTEHKPQLPHAAQSSASSNQPVPANAIPSGYANQVHSRIAAATMALASRVRGQKGRVGYHIVISPSGSIISQSITPSGNAAVDGVATQALHTTLPATGLTRNVQLSGAIELR